MRTNRVRRFPFENDRHIGGDHSATEDLGLDVILLHIIKITLGVLSWQSTESLKALNKTFT